MTSGAVTGSDDPTGAMSLVEMRTAYLRLLLDRAKQIGADDEHEILDRIERAVGLAETETQLFDRIERSLVAAERQTRPDPLALLDEGRATQ